MTVVNSRPDIINLVSGWKKEGLSIGLVPTMGYLHEGHASLIKRAREENDRVVVSDFVNPTQFGPGEDLETYPRDFDMDKGICEDLGADAIFHPSPQDMYGGEHLVTVHVDRLTAGLCGASRPVHFDGVCLVVNKLFNLSRADRAYFGEKDAQQLAVIRQMVRDLDMPIEVIGCPIIREEDGLAKSSRNVRLPEDARKKAPEIHKALLMGRGLIEGGEKSVATVVAKVSDAINSTQGMDIDYVSIVGWDDLKEIDTISGPVLLACAVRLGGVRLIDNEIIL